MNRLTGLILIAAALGLGAVHPAQAESAPPAAPADVAGVNWTPLPGERLAQLRGGYTGPSGLVVSFGFERIAEVNGQVVATTRIQIPDLGRVTAEQARALSSLEQTAWSQAGEGVTALPGMAGTLVIQNAVDGQQIATRTTIDAGVGTLGLFQALNLGSALHNALINGSGSP